jgi:hypothetical protein
VPASGNPFAHAVAERESGCEGKQNDNDKEFQHRIAILSGGIPVNLMGSNPATVIFNTGH